VKSHKSKTSPGTTAIVQQLGAQIPWKHNCLLLDPVKDADTREFYIRKTVEHGWSRSVLVHQLDTELHRRQGKAPTNFQLTLANQLKANAIAIARLPMCAFRVLVRI